MITSSLKGPIVRLHMVLYIYGHVCEAFTTARVQVSFDLWYTSHLGHRDLYFDILSKHLIEVWTRDD